MVLTRGLEFIGDSHERAREIKSMVNPIAMREFGKGDSASMDKIIDQYQKAGKGASQMADDVMRAAEAYAALTGTSITAGRSIESFAKAGQFAKALGLDTSLPSQFVGGRYKYTGVRGDVNARFKGAAASFLGAGEENLHRFPEFLNMVNSITSSLSEKVLLQDPDAAINLASQLWSMGAGFQGDRGARFIAQTNSAIRNPRGEAMEAFEMRTARRFLGKDATYGDIKMQRLRGLNSPGFMKFRVQQWEKQFKGTKDQSLVEALGIERGIYSGEGARAAWKTSEAAGMAFDKKIKGEDPQTKLDEVIEQFTKSLSGVEAEYDLMIDNARIDVGQATVNITTSLKESVIGAVSRTGDDTPIGQGLGITQPGTDLFLRFMEMLNDYVLDKPVGHPQPGNYNPDNSLPNNMVENSPAL